MTKITFDCSNCDFVGEVDEVIFTHLPIAWNKKREATDAILNIAIICPKCKKVTIYYGGLVQVS